MGNFAEKYIYTDINQVPKNKVGLVLGTAQNLPNGKFNSYFYYRMEAVTALYEAGKIENIIVSGDNSTMSYNEPEAMRRELVKRGIPDEAIISDYAGFRTLDSIIRCKEIFGQQQFTVISQNFHNERAIYIARQLGIEAIGYNAKDVMSAAGFKTKLREYFAKTKAFMDVNIAHKQPKFLGQKIDIQ